LGVCKLRGARRVMKRELLCEEKENGSHVLLKCMEAQRRREKLLNCKWPNMNKETAFRNVLTGDKVTELRN
jgi:hypothetical protein